MEGYIFSINGIPKVAGPDLSPLFEKSAEVITSEARKVLAKEVSAGPSYVTVARNMREKGVMTFYIYFDGLYLNECSFKRLELL